MNTGAEAIRLSLPASQSPGWKSYRVEAAELEQQEESQSTEKNPLSAVVPPPPSKSSPPPQQPLTKSHRNVSEDNLPRKSAEISERRRRRHSYNAENVQQAFFSAVKRSLNPDHDSQSNKSNRNDKTRGLQKPVAVRITPPAVHRPKPMRIIFPHHSMNMVEPSPSATHQQEPFKATVSAPNVIQQTQPSIAQEPNPATSASNWKNVPRRRKKKRSPDQKYKMIKASWYHSVASKNRLGAISEDPVILSDSDQEANRLRELRRGSWHFLSEHQREAKRALLRHVNAARGECQTPEFHNALEQLLSTYDPSHFDPRSRRIAYAGNILEGIGISAGKPTFPGSIGVNDRGDSMYKLGTMSFDMFLPTQMVLSVQGTFVLIDSIDATDPEQVKYVPTNLLEEVRTGNTPVRTYNIVTACTIEPHRPEFGDQSPNKGINEPIQGVLTTYGFILPYPKGHRFSVWFTGGSLEVDGQKNEKWFQLFVKDAAPRRTFLESGKVLAAKLLMGASTNDTVDENGRLTYSLSRPMASHIDLLYLDQRMQIFRGSSGTMYVHVRIPGSHAVQQCQESNELLPLPRDPLGVGDDDSSDSDNEEQKWLNANTIQKERSCDIVRPRLRRINSGGDNSLSQPVPSKPVQSRIKSSSSYHTSQRAWYSKTDTM